TKSDLLIGFREFFDGIDDPMLQHQMFGWSNPDLLDAPFRPDLVPQHLKSMVDRLRRRRLALLRGGSSAGRLGGETEMFFKARPLGEAPAAARALDEADSKFALTDSLLRLAPRLQRYLETIFVAGEWSAKPVFLRGIYFTSSMREGKALDEAIALATGLPVDDLPEERSWQRDRAFFLRDLFVEKVFRESGLVTRATNTLQLLRKRQFAIFGSAGLALLLVLGFAFFGYRNLQRKVGREASYWKAGAIGWNDRGDWANRIVRAGINDPFLFTMASTNIVEGSGGLTLVEYQSKLQELAGRNLNVGWIFKPVSLGINADRAAGQRILFETSILKPLVEQTRNKMINRQPKPDKDSLERYQRALTALIRLEADKHASGGVLSQTNAASDYLQSFLSYLTESDVTAPDTNLVAVMEWTYSKGGSGEGKWPPPHLLGGGTLSDNAAIRIGLENYRTASVASQARIEGEVNQLDALVDALAKFAPAEQQWLKGGDDACAAMESGLRPAWTKVSNAWALVQASKEGLENPVTNLTAEYLGLERQARGASEAMFKEIASGLPDTERTSGLFADIGNMLRDFQSESVAKVSGSFMARSNQLQQLDQEYVGPAPGQLQPQVEQRWSLYQGACDLAKASFAIQDSDHQALHADCGSGGDPAALAICGRLRGLCFQPAGHHAVAKSPGADQCRGFCGSGPRGSGGLSGRTAGAVGCAEEFSRKCRGQPGQPVCR
ncbi:MAG: type VI secretion system protein, partial [Verrucomicrobia bacterium]|nr:type VI secretion system protein [Verrucomicrobiota bacterium]